MRTIHYIVLHCTATTQDAKVEAIQRYWKEELHWKNPGYHFIIEPNGNCHSLQPIEKPSNGVKGFNAHSIHISYIGGVEDGKPKDNRTLQQKQVTLELLHRLLEQFPHARILGHRDFPGVHKACPSFDVKAWLKTTDIKTENH